MIQPTRFNSKITDPDHSNLSPTPSTGCTEDGEKPWGMDSPQANHRKLFHCHAQTGKPLSRLQSLDIEKFGTVVGKGRKLVRGRY